MNLNQANKWGSPANSKIQNKDKRKSNETKQRDFEIKSRGIR